LAPAEQRELAAYIRDTWPAAYEAATCAAPTTANDAESTPNLGVRIVDRDALVRSFAEDQLWPLLSGLSYRAQREIVARYPFTSPALFDLLRQKSRAEGRRDPERGIELAELAVLSLDVSAEALGERIHELRALGWAWVGNARRLALDFPEAEEAFEEAVAQVALVKDWENSAVAADVYAFKGALRIFQWRFKDALELLDASLAIFERVGDRRRQTEEL
ncbi:MAG: hypothetical protein GY856_15525, partial [bacterium]|nr:hypothetical protein [bacterium]